MDGLHSTMTRLLVVGASLALTLAASAGCAAQRGTIPQGVAQADQFLFEQGQAALKDRKWMQSREYFRQIVDNYPQSPFRPDSKLAVGDTYLGENTAESLLLAINEFREFLTFYPTNARADYAQYRLAVAFSEQMLGPERDQTATRDTIKELDTFVQRYPNSALLEDARALLRQSRDRLSESIYRVGFFYYRAKWFPGAIDRFREVLNDDPGFSSRDAVYFHLAESLVLTDKKAEALPYYERVVREFEQSAFLERARARVAELKGEPPGA